ncbi:cupin-like domain-containing protein [Streptomyces sp. NBC_01387]|uniref:cupin-like domain-containing protein n=1 Tax=unclassified Streptomyces TaxID=2593676 RepID=UPI0020246D77|nr:MULTISPECIES: cupin-like domain-containing protein [unclassified Streptomyces]MCX4547616.1 cupin-like domain-containing protein [Streptomyces sp. NBC_01500]WSC19301.1 cupin-like domain-containing protein [Streptomyces sp. NBC_01766]WSV53324.1 cupin-like domain-containing protein [Streptomyces sp. NBC_01014]
MNSQLDLATPDLLRFPWLRGAKFFHARVRPGDVLFIPLRARDFVVHGLFHRREDTRFFFSPASE